MCQIYKQNVFVFLICIEIYLNFSKKLNSMCMATLLTFTKLSNEFPQPKYTQNNKTGLYQQLR